MSSWESEITLPEKQQGIQYAYIELDSDVVQECSESELLARLENEKADMEFITTPEHDVFIIPGTDYFSVVPIANLEKKALHKDIDSTKPMFYLSLGLIVFHLLIGGKVSSPIVFLMFVLNVLPFINRLYKLKVSKEVDENNFHDVSQDIKFTYWLKQNKSKSIYVFCSAIVIIYILQFFIGTFDSVEIAGLDKPETIGGDYWRTLTAIMMHVNIFHILINGMVLFFIGGMVIRITNIYVFALISLFSGILGNLFSVYFTPTGASVGASGALMGLFGFVMVMGLLFNKSMPRKVTISMIEVLVLTGLMGLVAWEVIDNAAHVGGLVGGILIGILILRKHHPIIPYQSNLIINTLGALSIVVFIAGFLFLIWLFGKQLGI